MPIAVKRALVSVSDKTGVAEFARRLAERGVAILSTGGTHALLAKSGIQVTEVASYTGHPEMMDGRVKTLHPKIHGGILALRDDKGHVASMREHHIDAIDMVVVNLYPFESTVAKEGVTFAEAVEQIDIGGPSMVRSAAKNHRFVAVVTDPADYEPLAKEIADTGLVSDATLRRLAVKAFELTASYDAAISRWLHRAIADDERRETPEQWVTVGELRDTLRYGENPHQSAAIYARPDANGSTLCGARVLGGKQLSYNNYVDLDAALALACEFEEPFAAVLKHNNPCGAACAPTLAQAIEDAWAGDPVSAFGSVLGFNRRVDLDTATFLTSGGRFVEAIVAPGFEPDALEHLRTVPKWGKNVRLVEVDEVAPTSKGRDARRAVPISGGFLVQDADLATESADDCKVVTKSEPTREQLDALLFANVVCKHVKSNAIVLATGTKVLGVGAGQMSRVDSVKLACSKAGDAVKGSVLASDAFFPFPDGPEYAMEAGVAAILEPGGSVRDDAVIAACDERSVPMVFTGRRHFRH
ncbi:MAG: bifunctional phosphoribosylaminoimidazolecarboxamide formyltransferase/IMP cyclohydrolase [Planctomycetota bacterium]